MAGQLSSLMIRFQSHFPQLRGEFSELLTSQNKEHRLHIRQSLQRQLAPLDAGLLELARRPRLPGWSISISHCPSVGGWVALPGSNRVGLDIEELSRIQLPIVRRISEKSEIQCAPRPEFIWCAKEAFYKGLDSDQPQVISELGIGDWTQESDSSYSYIGRGPKPGKGRLSMEAGRIFAVCVVSI